MRVLYPECLALWLRRAVPESFVLSDPGFLTQNSGEGVGVGHSSYNHNPLLSCSGSITQSPLGWVLPIILWVNGVWDRGESSLLPYSPECCAAVKGVGYVFVPPGPATPRVPTSPGMAPGRVGGGHGRFLRAAQGGRRWLWLCLPCPAAAHGLCCQAPQGGEGGLPGMLCAVPSSTFSPIHRPLPGILCVACFSLLCPLPSILCTL